MNNRITLNIPHSSINGLHEADWDSWENLVRVVNILTDWHTNLLFSPQKGMFDEDDVKPFVFPKNRFVVDAERLIDDEMESIGQGIVYTRFGELLHRNVSEAEKSALYKEREQYLAKIVQNILSNDTLDHNNILIDCHSFPSIQGNVDVCIGYNEDLSRPTEEAISFIKGCFETQGLTVGINAPYSNSLQPVNDVSVLKNRYMSFMIELNKRTYLNEEDRSLSEGFPIVRETIMRIYEYLLSQFNWK